MDLSPRCWIRANLIDVFIKQVNFFNELFDIISSYFKDFCCEMQYITDSFPVATCNNKKITKCKIVKEKKWRKYTASMRNYFYGVKMQLITTKNGINSISFYTRKNSLCKSSRQNY
jgi:hypothetical protein